MAAITPSTNLYLLKNPINLSKQNQLTFASATAQHNYFMSITNKLEVDNFTYQRKDYVIRYPACIDDILDYNYCMYQNSNYSNKWFYAYIRNMRWISDHMTEITIETDVYQTFMFDVTFKPSFVEREHVNDDTIGLHTIPEGLETGDYVYSDKVDTNFGDGYPIIMVTEYCQLNSTTDDDGYDMENTSKVKSAGGTMYSIYQGCMFLLCGDDTAVRNILASYADAGKLDAVVGLFMAPNALTNITNNTDWYYTSWSGGLAYGPFLYLNFYTTVSNMNTIAIGKPYNNIGGISPKNNKLYTYPYIYLMGTNNSGISVTYQYELFHDTDEEGIYLGYCRFNTRGVISPGCSIKTIPLYYKGLEFNYAEGMALGKYPICSYSGDVYTNWLTQNSVNTAISFATSGLQVLAGAALTATGGGALMGASQIASGLTGIASTIGAIYEHSLMPPQIQGDTNTGDVNFSQTKNNFSFYKAHIKPEMITVIDNYFSMFGYKVNVVKVPNLTGRTYWNYVKTIDCNIEGHIPEFYMDELKNLFNAGITLWHDSTKFLDYSQTNSIVS